jgi:predicted amidohydrolase YtcJ
MSPMRDAIDKGLKPTHHTDFPVAPLDQMSMLWAATNRLSRTGGVVGPGQRVKPLEALKGMTLWAARQYGEESSKGSLEVGKLADMVRALRGQPCCAWAAAARRICCCVRPSIAHSCWVCC